MKKIKLALVALASVVFVGGAIAANVSAPGDYYPSATSMTPIPGQKGVNWDCDPSPSTCAYLEQANGDRTAVEGQFKTISNP